MKSKDIGLIVFVAVVSGVLSLVLSGMLISGEDKQQSVEVVAPISADFQRPPKAYFNSNSVNPTQEIRIGQDEGSSPFSEN